MVSWHSCICVGFMVVFHTLYKLVSVCVICFVTFLKSIILKDIDIDFKFVNKPEEIYLIIKHLVTLDPA